MPAAALWFRALAHNNGWANHRLYEACARLGEPELRAPRTSFFPSIALTLHHLLLVDLFYLDALMGNALGAAIFTDHDRPPSLGQMRSRQAESDRRLASFCEELDEAGLTAPVRLHRENHVQTERADRVLLHLFQHQIHHRGQAHAMLAGTRAAPPQLDEFFLAEDLPLRSFDFKALGYDEGSIWRDS